jgi:hypothetical protein
VARQLPLQRSPVMIPLHRPAPELPASRPLPLADEAPRVIPGVFGGAPGAGLGGAFVVWPKAGHANEAIIARANQILKANAAPRWSSAQGFPQAGRLGFHFIGPACLSFDETIFRRLQHTPETD